MGAVWRQVWGWLVGTGTWRKGEEGRSGGGSVETGMGLAT